MQIHFAQVSSATYFHERQLQSSRCSLFLCTVAHDNYHEAVWQSIVGAADAISAGSFEVPMSGEVSLDSLNKHIGLGEPARTPHGRFCREERVEVVPGKWAQRRLISLTRMAQMYAHALKHRFGGSESSQQQLSKGGNQVCRRDKHVVSSTVNHGC
jgi:hypothetical protein